MPQPTPNDGGHADVSYRPAEPAVSPDEGALEAAVRTTLESAPGDARATAEEIAALREVAVRFGPCPLNFEPIAIELVAAIINVNYGGLYRTPDVWRAIALKIASALYESPAARSRLENLWRRLHESHGPDA